MINTYHEIRETWRQNDKIPDLSTAAFVVAIEKTADAYTTLGVFP